MNTKVLILVKIILVLKLIIVGYSWAELLKALIIFYKINELLILLRG
jgi:hypothetical protein